MKIASYVIKGIRYDVPRSIMAKGGPGSGIYMRIKTPEEQATYYQEIAHAKSNMSEDRFKDYMEHRRYGTPHEFAMGLAERRPQSSYAIMTNEENKRTRQYAGIDNE